MLSERGQGWRMDGWHGDGGGGGGMLGFSFFGGLGWGVSWLCTEWCLVLMRRLFIKSTQGGCASA